MLEEIGKIEEALKTEESPTQLASYLTKLAAWNSFYTAQLQEISLAKPAKWLEIQSQEEKWTTSLMTGNLESYLGMREKPLSDKKTEMIWCTTEQGQEELNLTFILKRLDILYRSISKRLSAIENDYRMSRSQV